MATKGEYFEFAWKLDHFAQIKTPQSASQDLAQACEGKPLEATWKSPRCELNTSASKTVGDFPYLAAWPAPVFSDRAVNALAPLLGDSVEMLPLATFDGVKYSVVNLVEHVDALDQTASQIDESDGVVLYVHEYAFRPGAIGARHLFQIPERRFLPPLVSSEFAAAVQNHRLVGARFVPLMMRKGR